MCVYWPTFNWTTQKGTKNIYINFKFSAVDVDGFELAFRGFSGLSARNLHVIAISI